VGTTDPDAARRSPLADRRPPLAARHSPLATVDGVTIRYLAVPDLVATCSVMAWPKDLRPSTGSVDCTPNLG